MCSGATGRRMFRNPWDDQSENLEVSYNVMELRGYLPCSEVKYSYTLIYKTIACKKRKFYTVSFIRMRHWEISTWFIRVAIPTALPWLPKGSCIESRSVFVFRYNLESSLLLNIKVVCRRTSCVQSAHEEGGQNQRPKSRLVYFYLHRSNIEKKISLKTEI